MANEIQKLKREKDKYISLGKYKDVAAICHGIGAELAKKGKYEEALEFHTEALEYSEKLNDRFEIAVSNRMLGECYAEDNNFKRALIHIKKYLDHVVHLGNAVEEQRAWATFGRTYYMKYCHELEHDKVSCSKTLDFAEQSYNRALLLAEDLRKEEKLGEKDFSEMRARLLLNLGLVCEDRGNLLDCAKYIQEAIALATKYDLLEDLNRCQSSLANVCKKHGEYSQALTLYNGVIASSEKLQDKTMMCDALFSKAYVLIALRKDFEGAKKCLGKAYRLHTSVEEDHERITRSLKSLIGLCEIQKKLQTLDVNEHLERKELLEKIADTLSALELYKLAIEFYLSTLKCIEDAHLSLLEKAPIYYSIAQTYYDDGNYEKACEYFEKEFDCNENKPVERVKTLWKIADIFEEQEMHENAEKRLLNAKDIAKKINNLKLLHLTLEKLKTLYESNGITNKLNDTLCELNAINVEDLSSEEDIDVEENTENLFDDVSISDMLTSESDEEKTDASRRRRRTKKCIVKVNEVGETPLHQACIKGNLNMVKKLIDTGHPINARDACGWTPLHEACNHGWYDIVEYLIDKGADINDRGGELCKGVTPLIDAAGCGHLEIIRLLVSKGATVTVKNDDGETALQALLNWKVSEMRNLDANYLKLCEIVENDLKSSMIQAGLLVENYSGVTNEYSFEDMKGDGPSAVSNHESRTSEKRSRSPSLSPDIESYEDELPLLHFGNEPRLDYDDAETAQAEYKAAISNVRRSAKTVSPVKKSVFQEKVTSLPALLKETEVVNEWLIKDTNQIPKVKRKRRRMNNLSIRTSKSINNYLMPQEVAGQSVGESNIIVSDDDDNSIVSCLSVDSNPQMNFDFDNRENNETAFSPEKKKGLSSKLSFCLRVRITDKLILVPIPEETCNIEWLMEEAAIRYQSLTGKKPHLTLMTKEGAQMLNTDLIQNIFNNNDEVLSNVKFWIEPSLSDWYEQLCTKHGSKAVASVKKRFQLFESTHKLDFSNCSIPTTHLNLIFTSVRNFKTLRHLDISGTIIAVDSIKDFLACIPSFISLVSLNMSCCCITTQGIKLWSECLNNCNSAVLFPSLQTLNLSHNVFTPDSYCFFVAIFKLPSLINLDLSSCNLKSSFFSKSICNSLKIRAFQNFDISNNDLDSDGISEFLVSIQKQSLRVLNLSCTIDSNIGFGHKLKTFLSEGLPSLEEIILRGCNLTNEDLKYISSIFPHCTKLKVVDLSANPKLLGENIADFLLCAYKYNVNITKLSSSGTFLWRNANIDLFAQVFKHKILNHLFADKCPLDLSEDLFNLWKNVWESKAVCMNNLFCELKIA
ncbi:tonsoku-like protein [Uloborus diversus]|uniref:tonsoku-like protein n=1 Tax=Uloborus diversus TaxID=327109 RepID=UPI0024096418|nr:tonsoku-like protein [Uloborus diversus]